MTTAAHGIWFTEKAGVAGSAFHMALGIWFDGDLDEAALAKACAAVIARHEALSTVFTAEGFAPAAEKVALTHAAFSPDRVSQELARPFDLGRGPLARFTLLRENPRRCLLLFTAHHLVFDGMSKDILINDLALAYNGNDLGPLAPLTAHTPAATQWSPPQGDVILPGLIRQPAAAEPGLANTFTVGLTPLEGVTRFEHVLAAIHLVLARYGNAGLPVAVGLSTRDSQHTGHIGLFVNELPVTVAPAVGSFREYALGLRSRLRELYQRRDVPLSLPGVRPTPSLTPISVGYRRRGPAPAFAGVDTEVQWALFAGSARNAMHVQIVDDGSELLVSLQHSPTAIDSASVTRIAAHLRHALAAAPERDVARLVIEPVPSEWNATERPYPAQVTVLSLVEEQARQRPDAIAIADTAGTVTYGQLQSLVTQRSQAMAAGSIVPLKMGRGLDAVVSMLAATHAGAAYLPVDPAYPVARQELILQDALSHPVDGEVAYVMYTSGSTGKPKGVAVPHRALANLLLGMAELLGSGPDDRWLNLTSLSFDISGLEIFLPLVTGGRLIIASEVSGQDGRAVNALIREHGVTHVQATPSGWRVLLESDLPPGLVALAGGEALPLDLARQLRARVARLFNVYGPTETTIWSSADEIPSDPEQITIGRPIANTQLHIVDEQGQSVPIGVPGELCIGGHGLANGYLGQPELTAERFISLDGQRVYRTGDLCVRLSDGRVAYLGRSDSQVKVRGHRVELGEIEQRLREHPQVTDAAVALRGEQLVGYVIPAAPADLKSHLAQTLPAAMIPSLFLDLDRLPLTPNGKLDRAALPAPAPRQAAPVKAAPTDEIAAFLKEIWQELLSIDEVGLDEDLFDLGGHSLTITRINGRIFQRYGIEVPLEIFFDTPTIAEIADYVREAR
ncbi:hypothetical protein Rhe02_90980 [Rhizocola hellebori]|uniref:Carrier domain-containing protein n=1 Tax=Rhizocola hellebori TaxID=1392758 RepID=A0A8J3QL01_9ACTN|nr:amino acid adenylation domain-containing protein [Rhizocola hellebori]GIH11031.1 hypothetical protein Rhe02_90980 [Rhizocola hellebori]